MRAVILGGTFNPIHIGHLCLADEVRCTFRYEKVLFVPSNIPAHKKIESEITPEQRLAMLELAVSEHPFFLLDTCEIDRGGISYTIDTINFLSGKYKLSTKPGFVLGDDLACGFFTWKNAKKLSKTVDIILARRENKKQPAFVFPHSILNNLILSISSSDIRSRIRDNRAVQFLLPCGVWEYIKQNGLYKG